MAGSKSGGRIEKDSMGQMEVPIDAYYGASTMRAVLNFPISSLGFPQSFIRGLATLKGAAAQVNVDLGLLEPNLGKAIIEATQEVASGTLDSHFVVDIFQTGSGTSTNMNANEVIANRATEILGGSRGQRLVHPNDHVNMGQSSNDMIPTAIHVGALESFKDELVPAIERLQRALEVKSKEFWPVIKTGRTHLQDATPIRLGQEFLGFAGQMVAGRRRIRHAEQELSEVAIGGTAVGTGINTHPEFAARVCHLVSQKLGVKIQETSNHFQAQSTLDALLEASGVLRTLAVSMHKIANDIRWMGSGPRSGLGELALPEVQPGSSIMPGKVNPVIAESLIQVVAQCLGNDTAILQASLGSYFELNTMMPVAAHNLLQNIRLLSKAADNFTKACVLGLTATPKGPEMVEQGLAIGTALAPIVGYDTAAKIAKEAATTGQTIREVAAKHTKLTEAELIKILDAEKMTEPNVSP